MGIPQRGRADLRPAKIDPDILVEGGDWPNEASLAKLVDGVLSAMVAELDLSAAATVELSLVFADDHQVRRLNAQWRGRDNPTNVLSFPAFPTKPGDALPPVLGDVVFAFETVSAEAEAERKPFDHHLSHLLVHGVLHLIGHDHEADEQADTMETLEKRVLARLAISDPYA